MSPSRSINIENDIVITFFASSPSEACEQTPFQLRPAIEMQFLKYPVLADSLSECGGEVLSKADWCTAVS